MSQEFFSCNFKIPPYVSETMPCGKTSCECDFGKPYPARSRLCTRAGCDCKIESPCPAVVFCSEECFNESGMAEKWAAIAATKAAETPPGHVPVPAPPPPRRKKRGKFESPSARVKRLKEAKKRRNRETYKKNKASGKAKIYQQRFVDKRREENLAKKAASVTEPVEAEFQAG